MQMFYKMPFEFFYFFYFFKPGIRFFFPLVAAFEHFFSCTKKVCGSSHKC